MNTWTCNRVLFGAALLAGLAACSETAGGLFSSEPGARANTALPRAEMMRGALTLVPPDGFCIDRRGLRADFAVIARCDSLGSGSAAADAPLGFITVSASPLAGPFQTSAAENLPGPGTAVLSRREENGARILHLTGPTPAGTDARHWKAAMSVGSHAVAFSAYGPPNGRLAAEEGGALIASLARRTQAASAPGAQRDAAGSGAASGQRGPVAFLSGLFD